MLVNSMVKEVRRLLGEGKLSQRKIARVTGISRCTVSAIASGKRPDYPPRRPTADEPWKRSGPRERCPTCGGLVYMPCRVCRLRSRKALGVTRLHSDQRPAGPLQLDLHPEHQHGYEEMHAKREKAELKKTDNEVDK